MLRQVRRQIVVLEGGVSVIFHRLVGLHLLLLLELDEKALDELRVLLLLLAVLLYAMRLPLRLLELRYRLLLVRLELEELVALLGGAERARERVDDILLHREPVPRHRVLLRHVRPRRRRDPPVAVVEDEVDFGGAGAGVEGDLLQVLVRCHLGVAVELLGHLARRLYLLPRLRGFAVGVVRLEGDGAVVETLLVPLERLDHLVVGVGLALVLVTREVLHPLHQPVQRCLVVERKLLAVGLLHQL
mmetsp:Transcript_5371/g.12976  ORF Transcript_5371/g.12976 Transcript_5371/m.12976 type:complete len:245 (-) Transcript_5371:476-1210(-)